MKRLPFALVALSLSVPVVACLNNASEDVASGENHLSEEAKAACNFALTEVPKAVKNKQDDVEAARVPMTSVPGKSAGQKFVWGDFDGDSKIDFAVATGPKEIRVYKGDGAGNFVKAKGIRKVKGLLAGRAEPSAITLLTTGDFNGDGKMDVVSLLTTSKEGATGAEIEATKQENLEIFYGAATDSALEAPQTSPSLPDAITAQTYYHVAGNLDGDADKTDDLVLTTEKGEILAFGAKDGTMKPGSTGLKSDHMRSLAFVQKATATKPAALVIATPAEIATITFDAAHAPTVTKQPFQGSTNTSRWLGTDLDLNSESEIAILGPKGLAVVPVGPQQAATSNYEGMPGEMIGALNLDGDDKSVELLYKVDDANLFAACGAGEKANEIVATPLKVAYNKNIIVAGQLDIDGDKRADLVTVDIRETEGPDDNTTADIDESKQRGTVKVYLSKGKNDPAPELKTFAAAGPVPAVDAGVDATTKPKADATPEPEPTVDAGVDATPEPEPTVDAGVDATTEPPPVDAGVDAAKPPKKDAGTPPPGDDDDSVEPEGEEDDDYGETPPPDPEGSGTKTKKPSTKPSNGSTGSATVSIIPKPQTTDDGCSAAPIGTNGVSSSSVFGGLFAAMMLLVRRRRNSKK